MAEDPDTPQAQERSSLREHVADLLLECFSVERVLAALAALVLVVVAATGGFSRAVAGEKEPPPTREARTAIAVAPFEVSVRKALQGRQLKPLYYEDEKVRYLFVNATVKNTTDHFLADRGGFATALTRWRMIRLEADGLLAGGQTVDTWDKVAPEVWRVHDTAPLSALQPGIEMDVLFAWQQSKDVPAPERVIVHLQSQTERVSSLDGSVGWFDATTVATVPLPVEPVKEH